jgi:hypothetical protein
MAGREIVTLSEGSQNMMLKPPSSSKRGVGLWLLGIAALLLGVAATVTAAVALNQTSSPLPLSLPIESPSSKSSTYVQDGLVVIQNVKSISSIAKAKIVKTIKKMKTTPSAYDSSMNAYDYFVKLHLEATLPSTQVHAGWYFYPWHREMVYRFSKELRRISGDDSLWFPYWDWTSSQSTDALLDLQYFGGEGRFGEGYLLREGNFAHGNWTLDPALAALPLEKSSGGLLRAKGNGLQMCFDAMNKSYVLDTPYNPPHVDTLPQVGPFVLLPDNGPPTGQTQLFLRATTATRNQACPWSDLACVRQYEDLGSNTLLSCRHFAVRLPVASDTERCMANRLPYTFDSIGLNNASNPWSTTKDYYASNAEYWRACFEGIDPAEPIAKVYSSPCCLCAV